jgi:hypothetical protein|tara:strand:- start:477 stop:869 length:393 start_codon:yes stop_codon:yes gene_type:complete
MSNEVAVVRFDNGDVFYTAYHGTSSAINYVLVSSEKEVIDDPFPDPEWDAWESKPEPKESLDEFYRRLNEATYSDEESVEVYTPYAGGIHWIAKASRAAMRITGGFSDESSQDGCPDWAIGLIESNGLRL